MCKDAQMDWDDLRFVLALSRHPTLSAAALALGVTHTTVGRRLRAMEEGLGVRLFERTPEGYIPTAAGADIVQVAAAMEEQILLLEGRVLGRDARLQGKLRVTTMDMIFRHAREAIASFVERYPSVDLTLCASDDEVSLTRREADVALRMSNTPPGYLVGRKVGRVDFAVYASKALVCQMGPGAGYSDYPWLHWDERLQMDWLDAWLAQQGPPPRIAMRIGFSPSVLRQAIAAGIGVHFLACMEGDLDPELQRIGPVEPQFSRDLWLLTLDELRHTPRVRAFMDHVAEFLGGGPGRSTRHAPTIP